MTWTPTQQWLVLLLPYILLGAVTWGWLWLLLPLGGTLGLWVGFTTTNAHFTLAFKAGLALACAISLTLLVWGWPRRHRFTGKASCAGGLYLWCVAGVVGLGPQ